MAEPAYRFISNEPDYRHLRDPERYRALYEEVGTVEANTHLKWREEWMKHFHPRPASLILELGSHNGPNLVHYARLGHRLHGVELSSTLLATCRRHVALEPPDVQARITLSQGWIEEYRPDPIYDHVLCTEVLEHVVDPTSILRVAARGLKADGSLYVTSPTSHWGNNTHVRGVPVAELEVWLADAGLAATRAWSEDNRTFCHACRA